MLKSLKYANLLKCPKKMLDEIKKLKIEDNYKNYNIK